MSDYQRVSEALSGGADPAMLCATCPWDRYCITPPSMTKAEIEKQLAESAAKDDAKAAEARAEGKEAGMPVGSLLTTLMFAGRDTQAGVCPVFAARLRSSTGREIVDGLKRQMQGWDDNAGAAS